MDDATVATRKTNDERLSNPEPARKESAEGVAESVGRRLDDAASYAGHKAGDAARAVGHRAGDAEAAMGSGLRSLGQNVRGHAPESGVVHNAASALADTLENSGRYLQEEGIKDMAEDVTNLVRRNPIPALLLAIGAGFLIGRALSTRNKSDA